MPLTSNKPRFPIWTSILLLSAIAAMAGWLLSWVMPRFFPPASPTQVGQLQLIVQRSIFVVWLAAMLGAIPLFLLARRGVMATVTGYFIGSGIRLVLCLGAVVYFCIIQSQPALPTGLAMVAAYLPLLLLETLLVGRYLVSLDHHGLGQDDKSPDPANNQTLKETQA